MTEPFPIPRQLRATDVFVGNGGATYSDFDFKIFDIADVEVWAKAATETAFTKRTVAVAKLNNLPFDDFSVTFSAGQPNTTAIVVRSARLAERTSGVDNGTRVSMYALEKELSKQATVQQEVRRDLGRTVMSDFGEDGLTIDAGISDGITLMKQGDRLVAGPDIVAIGNAAEAARDIAAGYASDIVSQGNVPVFSTVVGMQAIAVPIGMAAVDMRGQASISDGGQAIYTRQASEPADRGKFQDKTGAWFKRLPDYVDYSYVDQAFDYASGGRYSFGFRSTDRTAHAMYDGIFPGIHHFDGVNSVVNVEAGSIIHHATALAGYIRNGHSATGFDDAGNSVALFGLAIAAVDHSAVWLINGLAQDSDTRVAGNGVGRQLISELDYNVTQTGTSVIGLSVGGNCVVAPLSANAFIANSLEGSGTAGLIKWQTGFWSPAGCSVNALVVGPQTKTGPNFGSQNVIFQWRDESSDVRQIVMKASPGGYLQITGPDDGSFTNLYVQSANLVLDSGSFLVVGGKGVVGDRQVGWGASTGTENKGIFDADYSQTMDATYNQGQAQAANNRSVEIARRLYSLEKAMTNHGLIGAS